MKRKKSKKLALFLFIGINVIFVFLQIHKQSYIVKLYYEKQRLEKQNKELSIEKANLIQKYYELKNPSNIRKYVVDNLDMQKTKLNQVKKIKIDE